MKKLNYLTCGILAAANWLALAASVGQTSVYSNGFESSTTGWQTEPTDLTRVPSGTGGITSSSGSFHAQVGNPFTRWGSYRSVFQPQGYKTSVDIYLDVNGGWANDKRFDFTSAINTPAGSHRRDFAFNAGFYSDAGGPASGTNRFIISASNGTGRGNSYPKNPSRNPVAISSSGWYTFEQVFSNNGSGVLSVVLAVKDSGGVVQGSWTLSDPSDIIGSTVGGNRYGWFASNEFPFLAVDQTVLSMPTPPPFYNSTQSLYFETIAGAIAAANSGDTIVLAAGTYTEAPIDINKAVTIQGPNAGVAGTGVRMAEARISNTKLQILASGVVIDGVEIYQTDATLDAVLLQAASTVRNSIIRRESPTTGNITRGITTAVGLTGVTITGNLFTGDPSGGLFSGHKTWNNAIYSNGGGATISGNTFENVRSALNLDDFNPALVISGNLFLSAGNYISFGGVTPTAGAHTVSGNEFHINFATPASVTLFNNSFVASSFRVNATGNTFGGIATTALTDAQKFVLEARIIHRGRSGRNGVIDYIAGQQIVTAGTTIASAIDAATVGNSVLVGPGTFTEDVVLNKSISFVGSGAGVTTLKGTKNDGTTKTVHITVPNVEVSKFTITRDGNTPLDWNGALNIEGISIDGVSGVSIHDNIITGNRNGMLVYGTTASTIRNNVITNNRTGLHLVNQTNNLTVTENSITNNWTAGVLFREEGPSSATGSVFNNNDISGNWYAQIVDRHSGVPGSKPKNFENNWFGSTTPMVTTADSTEPGYAAQIPVVFGGAATAPGSKPDIAGPSSANIDIAPFYGSSTDTDVETTPGRGTFGFQGNVGSLRDGLFEDITVTGNQTFGDLYVAPGTVVSIPPSTTVTFDKLELGSGAELNVNGGTLNLGQGSSISGTFLIFNSFGSFYVNGDTTFTINQSLALITDIHVADGKTITVNGGGELILDGCTINSQVPGSPYSISVATDGLLTIARSVVTDAAIAINTTPGSVPANLRSLIYDSRFEDTDLTVNVGTGTRVYHNLFDNVATNSGVVPAPFANVDGWGNVTSEAALENRYGLHFQSPVNPTRTLDALGNLYVQPSDPVVLKLDVGTLGSHTMVAAEALLGYNSGLLSVDTTPTAVKTEAGWSVIVDNDTVPPGGIGLVDSAIGLDLIGPGNNGISGPATIAKVNFTALAPGRTIGFFRVQTNRQYNAGVLVKDTRLTKSAAGVPSFLTAFTENSGDLVIDNQTPTIAAPASSGTQIQPSSGNVDILAPGSYVFRNGTPVILTFTATDAGLAGLDAPDATNDLELHANNGVTNLGPANYTVTATGTSTVTYTVTLNIPNNATTGVYALTATVLDRSGNVSPVASLGSFTIANEVLATVEHQSFVGTGPGSTRAVTFVATDLGGSILTTWTKAVSFTTSVGSVELENVPPGTVAISAKTDWSLRRKLAVPFTPEGLGAVSLTSASKLLGGDLNGDNVVNTLDYSTLRFYWATATLVADISGDGAVFTSDYNPLRDNFFTVGDAL